MLVFPSGLGPRQGFLRSIPHLAFANACAGPPRLAVLVLVSTIPLSHRAPESVTGRMDGLALPSLRERLCRVLRGCCHMSVYQHQPMPALILKILSVDLPSMSKVRGLSLFFVPRVVPRFWPEPSRPSLVPDFVPHFAGLPSVVRVKQIPPI